MPLGCGGLRPYFLVLDEVAQWPETRRAREIFDAATTASIKVDGRMVLLTTAGRPSHWSYEVRNQALADPLWHVHEIHGPAPWLSPERLASERARRPPSVYARLFDNLWTEDEDRLSAIADVAACVRDGGALEPERGVTYFIGVDLATTSDLAAAVVLHCEPASASGSKLRRVVVDRVLTWKGTRTTPVPLTEVEKRLVETGRTYNNARFVIDPWQGVGLAERLKKAGFRVNQFAFTASSVGLLATTVVDLLQHQLLSLPNDPELIRELERVRLVERTPGIVRMDHDRGDHDDRATALALAALEAVQTPERYAGSRVLSVQCRPSTRLGSHFRY